MPNLLQPIEALMGRGRWLDAQSACRALLFDRPTDARLHAYEGLCLFRLGDFAAAEPCFMRATALDPAFVDAGVKRCQCLERMGRFDAMLELAREWQRKKPSEATLALLIRSHGQRGDMSRTESWEVGVRRHRAIEYAA